MANRIIDIGAQGNDGTGDSIRDSFRKVNENFNELYSILGAGGSTITLSQLDDGTSYAGNQLIMGNLYGTNLTARSIVQGSGIEIEIQDDAVTISSAGAHLSNDSTPMLSFPFNANYKAIGRLADPSQALVDSFNKIWDTQTTLDELPVTVGYANRNFVQMASSGSMTNPVNVRDEPEFPDITNSAYDPTLTGNFLATEVLPRKHVVYRGGDTMTGKLYLNDHPGDMAGVLGTNSKEDYVAATAYYVDTKTFSSNVNLYVSTSGDDLQIQTPAGKEGRYWNYAYKSIKSALLQAESLINVASQEPSPYKQRISYNVGPDHHFSKIQKITLTDGNTSNLDYIAAYNLLQSNKEFIQAETIAYINKKYVNSYVFDSTTLPLQEKISSILDSIGYDIVLGATNPNSNTSSTNYNSYWEGVTFIHNNPTNDGLLQWVDTINYVRDQIIEFSYDTYALRAYTSQIIDAVAYDVAFLTNYNSIQAAIAFNNAGTDVSNDQMAAMLVIKPIAISLVECDGISVTVTFQSQPNIVFPVGSRVFINATLTARYSTVSDVTLTSYLNGVISYLVTASTLSTVTFAKSLSSSDPSNQLVIDSFTVADGGAIDRKNLINQLLLTTNVRGDSNISALVTKNIKIISDYILTGALPTESFPSPINPIHDMTGYLSANQLLLENIPFIQAEILSFLSANHPTITYDKVLYTRDVKYLVWSVIYDLMYGGNSQSVYAGTHFWNTSSPNFINSYEKVAGIAVVNHINTLAQSIITNTTVTETYQQAVRQYKNDTLINGSDASTSILDNISTIALILDDINNVPAIVYPTVSDAVYTAITNSRSIYTTGATTSTSWFMNQFYFDPIINDTLNQNKIINLFKTITDIIELGTYSTALPLYPQLSVTINAGIIPEWIDQARYILDLSTISTIAADTSGYAVTQFGPGTPSNITINTSRLIRDIKNLVIAICYDITVGGTTASTRAVQEMLLVGSNAITTNIISNAATRTLALITDSNVDDADNLVATLINSKFDVIRSVFSSNPATVVPVQLSLYVGSMYDEARKLRTIIENNTTKIVSNTVNYTEVAFAGGFRYDEASYFRDIEYIVNAMSIDLITSYTDNVTPANSLIANYQSVNLGKGLYKTITAGGSHYIQLFNGINFILNLGTQVLNKLTRVRYQSAKSQVTSFTSLNDLPSTYINVTGNIAVVVSTSAKTAFSDNMQTLIDIIQYGVSVAPTALYGTGLWHLSIDNGGNDSVEQGSVNNNDLFPAKIVVGVGSAISNVDASESHGSIVQYVRDTDTSETSSLLSDVDTLQIQLTTPKFFKINEELEFGESITELNLTIFVESGTYYEHFPLRIPSNVTLKGDDARRTIVRPIDSISQSPWKQIFFYRDSVIDSIENGTVNYTTDYNSSNNFAPAIASNITATLDGADGSIVITLSNNYQAPLSWIGLVFADNVTSGFGPNLSERGRAVVDSVSGNTLNCTVIYPFSTNGVRTAGNWFLFNSQNYGYHYLTDPSNKSSSAKNNKDIDIFLCNEGVRIVGFTFQGHGGFIMVLDPTGNIKAKSPYIQECTSFAQSINSKRLAGAQFIDGFAGRLAGKLTAVTDGGITVTVTGGSTSGLHLRPPQPPCSFYVNGVRYQVDQVVSHTINNSSAVSGIPAPNGTVVLRLDTTTPYAGSTNINIHIEAGGNRSMLANNLSMFNDLGYGVIVTNGGFSEQVCSFTYYAYTGYWANNGGNIRAVGCSNTFGKYGLRSSGSDVTELPDSVSLENNLVQTARIYKTSTTASEMAANSINVWISDYDYTPTNVSELEINHIIAGGTISQYAVSSVTTTSIQVNGKYVLKLVLNTTSQNNSTSTSGLTYSLYHNQLVTIRVLQNFKFSGIDNVKPTRPSTALQFVDKLNEVYRIGAYNLVDALGGQLPAHTAILQSDVSFSYYKFYTDPAVITTTDSGSATCGSKVGDTKIAVTLLDPINDITIINQLQKGTYIVAWNGRVHRVIQYGTLPVPHLLIDSTPVVDNASNSISSLTLTFSSTTSGVVAGSQTALFTFATSTAPLVNTYITLTGNARYSGTYLVVESTTTSVTLYYPTGVGSTGTGTITADSTNTTGISAPFDGTTSVLLKVGYAANAPAVVTTRISTCRATSHDFCDIGTGSYSTTNIPYSIYGEPANPRDTTGEVIEQGVGRCFYVSTNQDGIFRVGRFFSVDQGTGTVTFSSKIALTNVQGLGFDRGVVVSEFTADSSFNNNASDVVPVVSATRSYIDKRLGISHSGTTISPSSRIGPGFVALNGSTPLEGNLAMGSNKITGLAEPTASSDAATRSYVLSQVGSKDTLSKLSDVNITVSDLAPAQVLIYDTSTSRWLNKTLTGVFSFSYVGGVLSSTYAPNSLNNGSISNNANIEQSKLNLYNASTTISASITGVTGSRIGTVATLTFALQTIQPFAIGTKITVSGFTTAEYNGVFVVTAGSTTTVKYIIDISAATPAVGTGTVTAVRGIASFNSLEFSSTDGWIRLASATSNTTGISADKLQYIPTKTVLANTTSGTAAVSAVSASDVVASGDGIQHSTFTSNGAMIRTSAGVYSVTAITTTGENSALVKTGTSGEIDAKQLKINNNKIIESTPAFSGVLAKVKMSTPNGINFLTSSGDTTANTVTTIVGSLDVTNITNSSGTAGILTGTWTIPAGSSLDVQGTLNTSTSVSGLVIDPNKPTIRPSVLFDFVNSRTLDPRITFIRSSIGTYYNETGLLTTADIDNPRFNFNPLTGESVGLLVEEERTNFLQYSETFQNWTYTSVTKSGSPIEVAPTGAVSAYQFTSSASNGKVEFTVSGIAPSGVFRTLSVWLKRVTGTGPISVSLDGGTNWYTTPTLTSTLTRYDFVQTNSTRKAAIRIETSGDSIIMWGAQLEDGGCVTSYIPTTTQSVVRKVDNVSITGTNFSSWYKQTEGTVILYHTATAINKSAVAYGGVKILNAGLTEYMAVQCTSAFPSLVYDASTSTPTQFDFTGLTTSTVNSVVIHALSYKTNLCSYSVNGAVAETDNTATINTSMSQLIVGGAGTQLISRFAFYPIKLTDAQLKSITTQ